MTWMWSWRRSRAADWPLCGGTNVGQSVNHLPNTLSVTLMSTIQTHTYTHTNCCTGWSRSPPFYCRSVQSLCLEKVQGFILNVPSRVSLGIVSLPLRRRHWLAVRQVNGHYYNLDSKLKSPVCIGGEAELRWVSAASEKMVWGFCQDFIAVKVIKMSENLLYSDGMQRIKFF